MLICCMFSSDHSPLSGIISDRLPKDLKKKYLLLGGLKWLKKIIRDSELDPDQDRSLRALSEKEQRAIAAEIVSGVSVHKVAQKYKISYRSARYIEKKFLKTELTNLFN